MTNRNRPFMHPWVSLCLLVAGAFSGLGCEVDRARDALRGLDAADAIAATHEPQFLRHSLQAPALRMMEITFVAVHGTAQVVTIPYASGSGNHDAFLRFELGAGSLLRGPDGSTLFDGDEVLISIAVEPDWTRGSQGMLTASMTPSGLEFDPSDPPKLILSFAHADPDVDGDGHPDLAQNLSQLTMWRQTATGEPWEHVAGARQVGDWGVEAELSSFSRYALAF